MKNVVLILLALLSAFMTALAQTPERKITPVETDDNKPPQPRLHYYDKHGEPLEEPVLFLAELDTVSQVKSGPVYPLYNGMSVGVNFMDAIFMAAGQHHGSFDVCADVSIHNWLFPTLEAGIGFGKLKPGEDADRNYSYRGLPSPYFKLGLDYNFLYKSDPAYRLFLGFRAGFSAFSYDISDISSGSGEKTGQETMSRQHDLSFYGELLAGIRVKIWGPLSMGWTVRFRHRFHPKDGGDSTIWFIPGYGTKGGLGFTYCLAFSF